MVTGRMYRCIQMQHPCPALTASPIFSQIRSNSCSRPGNGGTLTRPGLQTLLRTASNGSSSEPLSISSWRRPRGILLDFFVPCDFLEPLDFLPPPEGFAALVLLVLEDPWEARGAGRQGVAIKELFRDATRELRRTVVGPPCLASGAGGVEGGETDRDSKWSASSLDDLAVSGRLLLAAFRPILINHLIF